MIETSLNQAQFVEYNSSRLLDDSLFSIPNYNLHIIPYQYKNEYSVLKSIFFDDINYDVLYRQDLERITLDLGLKENSLKQLDTAIKKVKIMLVESKASMQPCVIPSFFVDVENSNWKELVLTIPISKSEYTDKIEKQIIRTIMKELDNETSRKVIIDVSIY
jgi:hypothetical protein